MPWFYFWMLSFKPAFSLSSFTFIKRLFSSSSLSVIRVVLSAYPRLLIFLILPCNSSCPVFHKMYAAYKLNKQTNTLPWCTHFPILDQSTVPCLVLTDAFRSAYRFLRRQVRWSVIPIPLRIFQFVVNHTVKGFNMVNEAEVDAFLEFSCFLYDPMNTENLTLVPLPF